jgi:hypothetical protein
MRLHQVGRVVRGWAFDVMLLSALAHATDGGGCVAVAAHPAWATTEGDPRHQPASECNVGAGESAVKSGGGGIRTSGAGVAATTRFETAATP